MIGKGLPPVAAYLNIPELVKVRACAARFGEPRALRLTAPRRASRRLPVP